MTDNKKSEQSRYVVTGIKLPVTVSHSEILEKAKEIFSKVSKSGFYDLHISKLSVDARKKKDVIYVASVIANYDGKKLSDSVLKKHGMEEILLPESPKIPECVKQPKNRPIVVGFGPAGMFAALLLSEAGFSPIVLERGDDIDRRVEAVEKFYKEHTLDPDSNIQFGAGGAGTFSDGKLITRINDGLCGYVLRRLVEFGAPKEILYSARPHIGTDKLRDVVKNIAARIEETGGEILYRSKMESLDVKNGVAKSVILSDGRVIDCEGVILALGHSARDTYDYLIDGGFAIEPKPFSVGVRIEHLQEDIDRAMYGDFAGKPGVPHAEYNLSHRVGERGVYTFCMCPGGEVMAAASEEGGIVTNGMSRYNRDGKNANAAVAVSVMREDYGNTARAAIDFQRKIERAAYAQTDSYAAPAQTVGEFLGRANTQKGYVSPTYMGGNVSWSGFDGVLPDFVISSLSEALVAFGRKIDGYDRNEAVLTGPETRTSAPVRILRNDNYLAVGTKNIYPSGEGAGYAGGITSAAIDGIKVALAFAKSINDNN